MINAADKTVTSSMLPPTQQFVMELQEKDRGEAYAIALYDRRDSAGRTYTTRILDIQSMLGDVARQLGDHKHRQHIQDEPIQHATG